MKEFFCRIIRKFYFLFNQKKILKDLSERKGECKRCGICCGNCPFLKFRGEWTYCEIYNDSSRPYICKTAPIRIDMNLKAHKNCGYYWSEKTIKD